MSRLRYAIICSLGLTLALSNGPEAYADKGAADDLFDYVVQEGDSCIEIAKRILGKRRHYRAIHRHNPQLGPLPHRLTPGMVLRLPRRDRRAADAHLTGKNGNVQVRRPTTRDWDTARRGMELFRTWRVHSRARSTAEITFLDESSIRMRENTVVIIFGGSKRRARRQTATASLERGSLRARLRELNRGKLVVTTPSAEAELTKGRSLVSVDEQGNSRIANHSGEAIAVRGWRAGDRKRKKRKKRKRRRKRTRAVRVAARMGTKVAPGQAPSKPQPLPASPVWHGEEREFLGWKHRGGTIRGRWQPVAKAERYRVEIASDSAMDQLLARTLARPEVSGFEAHGLPPGTYYVRVATIDGDGFESPPSQVATMRVLELDIALPDGIEPVDGERATDTRADDTALREVALSQPPHKAMLGARVVSPSGLACGLDVASLSDNPTLDASGRQQLFCRRQDGAMLAPIAVEIAAVQVRTSLPGGQELAPSGIARDRPTVLEIPVVVEGFRVADVQVQSSQGLRVDAVERVAPGRYSVRVQPLPDAPEQVSLQLVSGSGASAVPLARIPLTVAPVPEPIPEVVAEQPSPSASVAARKRWSGSLFTGVSLRSRDSGLGENDGSSLGVDGGFLLGARLGYAPHRSVHLEAELAAARPALRGSTATSALYEYRMQVRVPLLHGRVQPFALLGAGAVRLLSDHPGLGSDWDPEWFYGGGVTLAASGSWLARIDLRHVVTPGRMDGVSSNFEALVGGAWQF